MGNLRNGEFLRRTRRREPFLLQQHDILRHAFVRKYGTYKESKAFQSWLASQTGKDRTDRQTDRHANGLAHQLL
jgi:hypothetical protein